MTDHAGMLYESDTLRVTADDGIATVWLEFPGWPVNALNLSRLQEIGHVTTVVQQQSSLDILVIRSGKPAGFCGGHHIESANCLQSNADRSLFATTGQRILNRLAALDLVTLAFIEGPCRGPGLELALACDYRIAVAGPDSWFGFDENIPPCWGGLSRLAGRGWNRQEITAREAVRCGLIDDAFCTRRAKIELRQWLDRLQANPRKRRPCWNPFAKSLTEKLAAERTAFQRAIIRPSSQMPSVEALPESVGLFGTDERNAAIAVELAMRSKSCVFMTTGDNGMSLVQSALDRAFNEALRRGRVTPLEAQQALARIVIDETTTRFAHAKWIIADTVESLRFLRAQLSPWATVTTWDIAPTSIAVAWLRQLGFNALTKADETCRRVANAA